MKINKVTSVRPASSEEAIQEHFDEQNADGWNLIGVDNLIGWYRFFWEKDSE